MYKMITHFLYPVSIHVCTMHCMAYCTIMRDAGILLLLCLSGLINTYAYM